MFSHESKQSLQNLKLESETKFQFSPEWGIRKNCSVEWFYPLLSWCEIGLRYFNKYNWMTTSVTKVIEPDILWPKTLLPVCCTMFTWPTSSLYVDNWILTVVSGNHDVIWLHRKCFQLYACSMIKPNNVKMKTKIHGLVTIILRVTTRYNWDWILDDFQTNRAQEVFLCTLWS